MPFQKRGASGGGWKGGGKSFGDKKPWDRGSDSGGFRDSRGFDKPEMHRATCAQCNQSCEVPFRPNGSRPVYCSNCFKREDDRGGSREFTRNEDFAKPSFKPTYTAPGATSAAPASKDIEYLKKQVDAISHKLDALIEALSQIIPEDDEFEDEDGDDEDEEVEIVKIEKPAKVAKEKAPKKAKK